ncbi:MAG: hypothetical protein OEM59_02915 [Rhodospirillales bacterium]|nr:hypothetical protein [Rhodospirillales bacterium]
MGLSFGVFMTFLFVTQWGLFPGVIGGTVSGVLFGVGMAASYGVLYGRREGRQRLGEVRHEATITLVKGKKETIEACKESLKHINRRTKITKEDLENRELRAKAGMEWHRTADVISFSVRTIDDQSSEVEIESKPLIPTVITDQGSNLRNVEAIKAFFERHGLIGDNTWSPSSKGTPSADPD